MLGIRVPDTDEAMLVSGKGAEGAPARVYFRRAFVMPFFNHVRFLTLEQQQHQITEDGFTKEKIPVRVTATIAFKVPAEEQACIDAGQRFIKNQKLMPEAVGNITAGALRGILGEMTLEDIIGDRTALQAKVLDHAKQELGPQGLRIDTLNISDIRDLSPEGSAIAALAAPHLAEIHRNAAIAQATNQQQAAAAEQEAARKQADYERETAVTTAGYDAQVSEANATRDQRTSVANAQAKATISKAQAEADQAGPLEQAKASRATAEAETALATQNALLREQELEGSVVKQAEADAKRVRLAAEAEADATRLRAEAAASSNRVTLDQLLIEKLPDMIGAAAGGLADSNLTILNGAEGLSETVSGLVTQALTIFSAAKEVTASRNGRANGEVEVERPLEAGARR